MIEKVCTRCLNLWPRTREYFNDNRYTRDRLSSWCRACTNDATKAYQRRRKAECCG